MQYAFKSIDDNSQIIDTHHFFDTGGGAELNTESHIASDKKINILVLGQSGSGKSTWINSFVNYLSFDSFDKATNKKPRYVISTNFPTTDLKTGEADDMYFKSDNEDDVLENNECKDIGKSERQLFVPHAIPFRDVELKIIDTPGIFDTGGGAQYEINKDEIGTIVCDCSNCKHNKNTEKVKHIDESLKSQSEVVVDFFSSSKLSQIQLKGREYSPPNFKCTVRVGIWATVFGHIAGIHIGSDNLVATTLPCAVRGCMLRRQDQMKKKLICVIPTTLPKKDTKIAEAEFTYDKEDDSIKHNEYGDMRKSPTQLSIQYVLKFINDSIGLIDTRDFVDTGSVEQLNTGSHMAANNEINILIIGRSGSEKSTCIDSFLNYAAFDAFDEAANEKNSYSILANILKTDLKTGEANVTYTKSDILYGIRSGNNMIHVYETPGVVDKDDAAQYGMNVDDIFDCLSKNQEVTENRIKDMFTFRLRENMLFHFSRGVKKKILVFFANFDDDRDAFEMIMNCFEVINIDICFDDNLFASLNDSFICRCLRDEMKFRVHQLETFQNIWNAKLEGSMEYLTPAHLLFLPSKYREASSRDPFSRFNLPLCILLITADRKSVV